MQEDFHGPILHAHREPIGVDDAAVGRQHHPVLEQHAAVEVVALWVLVGEQWQDLGIVTMRVSVRRRRLGHDFASRFFMTYGVHTSPPGIGGTAAGSCSSSYGEVR
jgi:hypothetical protein